MNATNADIQVSIILTTFNHENYIAHAIDSILSQKTNFKYEIVIGDDASSDRTPMILKEYADKYPEKIVAVFRSSNLGGSRNFTELFIRTRGRYITFIDGDDYWIDENKLQEQYDYLEKNSTRFSVSHKVKMCDANENLISIVPRHNFKNNEITIHDFLKGKRFALTATMIRRPVEDQLNSLMERINNGVRNAGDISICLFLLDLSPIPILDKVMTIYRYRSIAGHQNYNSMTNLADKIQDKLTLLSMNDRIYSWGYYFGWLYIRLIATAVKGMLLSKLDGFSKITLLIFKILCTLLRSTLFHMFYKFRKMVLAVGGLYA